MLKAIVLYEAFRMFMERTRMVRGLPFPAALPESRMTKTDARAALKAMRRKAADASELLIIVALALLTIALINLTAARTI